MKTMYAIRIAPKGRRPSVIRLNTEEQAREWVESSIKRGTPAKYLGKVKVSLGKLGHGTNHDPKKR